jgi:hypothetical protein
MCKIKQQQQDQKELDQLKIKMKQYSEGGEGIASQDLAQNDSSKFYVVCLATRNGRHEFCERVEKCLFPPGTEKNELFELGVTVWHGMKWVIMVVPKKYAKKVKECALAVGMRVANGIPFMMHRGEKTQFPLSGQNVWTLKNGLVPLKQRNSFLI